MVALARAIEKDAESERESTRAVHVNCLCRNPVGFNGNRPVADDDGREITVTRDWTPK